MKIFNWVHRRFNHKAENAKRNGDIAGGEEQFPAENKCDDVFERWRGGILAIGTLGYDPLMDENEELKNGYFFEEDDDDDGNGDDHSSVKDPRDDNGDGEDEGNPLVLATYEELTVTETETETETEMEENLKQLQFGFEYVMMEKKERITLADLFVADSDKDHQIAIAKDRSFSKSDSVREKLSRKLTAKDVRPIHKLNKLMRRMLRRKIHPEVGPTNPKVEAVNNNHNYNYNYNCNYNYDYSKSRATDDYASLLPSQDANI